MGTGIRAKRRRRFSRDRPVRVGDVFSRLTVVADSGRRDRAGSILWKCACTCGNAVYVRGTSLKRGEYRSCGCWTKDRMRDSPPAKKHGMAGTPTYSTWAAMKKRCLNPKDEKYAYYGGRGISVTPRWNSFENFLKDMGEKPKGLALDRIDNDGHYEPSNCRWATRQEQSGNSSRIRRLTLNGKTQSVS